MIEKPLVSIIILNYNAGQLLIDCVDSILKTNYSNFEVIVVDNASKDHSHYRCKERFPSIILIENKDNLGYCEGNNVGIRTARGEFIVILNPDTLAEPDWLEKLVSAYQKHGIGLYQPKFLTTTNHKILMSTGNMIQLFAFGYSRGKGDSDDERYAHIETVGYASGTCLFTSSKVLRDIGMFDAFLFAYHDDLDVGWRAAMQGIKSYYVPDAIVYHPPEGFSFKWSPLKYYLLERNRHYCLLTHYSRSTFYKILPSLIFVEIAVFFFYLKKGMLREKIKASLDIIRNRKKISKRYHEIQNQRKISDKEIICGFSDDLTVPKEVADKKSNVLFNRIIRRLSMSTRKVI